MRSLTCCWQISPSSLVKEGEEDYDNNTQNSKPKLELKDFRIKAKFAFVWLKHHSNRVFFLLKTNIHLRRGGIWNKSFKHLGFFGGV